MAEEVATLARRIHALEQRLSGEVRTRRLVVVDDDGVEVAHLVAGLGGGLLRVAVAGDMNDDRFNGAELSAYREDVEEGGGIAAGLTIAIGGNCTSGYVVRSNDVEGPGAPLFIDERSPGGRVQRLW